MVGASVAKSMTLLLVPLFAIELGASASLIGGLIAMASVLPLFLAVPTGAFVDRAGPRVVVGLGSVLAMAPIAVGLAPSILTLFALQMAMGLAFLLLISASQTFIASIAEGKGRAVSFGWYTSSLSLGQLIGPIVAGLLADAFGYTSALIVAGVLPATTAIASRFFVSPPTSTTARTPYRTREVFRRAAAIGRHAGVQTSIAVSCGVLFALAAYHAFLPIHLANLSYTASAIGLLVSVRGVASVVIRPLMAQLIRAIGNRYRTMVLVMLIVGIGVGATAVFDGTTALITIFVLVGLGHGISQPLSMVTLADHVDSAERGTALGLRLTGNHLVQIVGPLVLGIVADTIGLTAVFAFAGLAALVIAGYVAALRSRFLEAEMRVNAGNK